jgi:hypothetical protein
VKEGILIGADQAAEKLLPWWWNYYSRYNKRDVVLVDFGMSKKGRAWCHGRIPCIECPKVPFVKSKESIHPVIVTTWKKRYPGPLWKSRNAWFKKPAACLLSPFDRTLWLDLDCEVCGSLDLLFAEWEEGTELAIAREDFRLSNQQMFNSGVILFQKGAPFLQEWNQRCCLQNGSMMGDQDVLTAMLLEGEIAFKELPPFYNWPMYAGFQMGILIAHWVSGWGKKYIQEFGGLHTLLKKETFPEIREGF